MSVFVSRSTGRINAHLNSRLFILAKARPDRNEIKGQRALETTAAGIILAVCTCGQSGNRRVGKVIQGLTPGVMEAMPKAVIDIKRLLRRADECRVLAGIVADETASQSYLRLAESYEAIAEEERRVIALEAAKAVMRNGQSFVAPSKPREQEE